MRKQTLCRTLIMTAVVMITSLSSKAEDIFSSLNDLPAVESTYVSGRFAHNTPVWRSQRGSHSMNLSKGFSALYTYQCYSEEAVKEARKLLKTYLADNKNIEVVMSSKAGHQEYVIYEKFIDEENISQMIIWNCSGSNVLELVVIDWDKGLKTSSNPYDKKNTDSSMSDDSLRGLGEMLGSLTGELVTMSESLQGSLGDLVTFGEVFGKNMAETFGPALETFGKELSDRIETQFNHD